MGKNKKSSDFERFKEYIRVKNMVGERIGRVYSNTIFRKLKWYSHVERERYFDSMVRKIKSTFGGKKVLYGDFEGKHSLKGTCPSPGIGLKRRISRDIEIYNLDEFRTSKLDHKFESKCSNMRVRDDNGKKVRKIHSILPTVPTVTYRTEQGSDGCIATQATPASLVINER